MLSSIWKWVQLLGWGSYVLNFGSISLTVYFENHPLTPFDFRIFSGVDVLSESAQRSFWPLATSGILVFWCSAQGKIGEGGCALLSKPTVIYCWFYDFKLVIIHKGCCNLLLVSTIPDHYILPYPTYLVHNCQWKYGEITSPSQ